MLLLLCKDHVRKSLHNPWALSCFLHVVGLLIAVLLMRPFKDGLLSSPVRMTYSMAVIAPSSRSSVSVTRSKKNVVASAAPKKNEKKKVVHVEAEKPKTSTVAAIVKAASTKAVMASVPKKQARIVQASPSPIKVEEKKRSEPSIKTEVAEQHVSSNEPLGILESGAEKTLSLIDAVVCHEFKKYWKAPDGVVLSCRWRIHISPQGKCTNVEWCDKEPVSAMAIAIRAACTNMTYPRQLWGKIKLVSL